MPLRRIRLLFTGENAATAKLVLAQRARHIRELRVINYALDGVANTAGVPTHSHVWLLFAGGTFSTETFVHNATRNGIPLLTPAAPYCTVTDIPSLEVTSHDKNSNHAEELDIRLEYADGTAATLTKFAIYCEAVVETEI